MLPSQMLISQWFFQGGQGGIEFQLARFSKNDILSNLQMIAVAKIITIQINFSIVGKSGASIFRIC